MRTVDFSELQEGDWFMCWGWFFIRIPTVFDGPRVLNAIKMDTGRQYSFGLCDEVTKLSTKQRMRMLRHMRLIIKQDGGVPADLFEG